MRALRLAAAGERISVLCIGAHSDDIEIGAGATLLTLMGRGVCLEVHWCVLSGGSERGGEAAAEQQGKNEHGKSHSRQMTAAFREDWGDCQQRAAGSDHKAAGEKHRVFRDHHCQEVRPLITQSAQQREFTTALQDIPQ